MPVNLRALFGASFFVFSLASYAGDLDVGLSALEEGDYKTAVENLMPWAQENHIDAQFLLGKVLTENPGGLTDYDDGLAWYLTAAQAGHANSMYQLGLIYLNGNFYTTQDTERAVHWLELAADNGVDDAYYDIANAYLLGGTLKPDPEKAASYLQQGVQRNDVDAIYGLARMYIDGYGVEQDNVAAFELYKLGASLAHGPSQNNLGSMYAAGMGVEQSYANAYVWFVIAADKGIKQARENASSLIAHLTEAEMALAKEVIDEYRAQRQGVAVHYSD